MPPRIHPHRPSVPSSCQCFRTRPRDQAQTRQFRRAAKPGFVNPKMTLLRREMMEWLHGPGRNFLQPLPASTNYLSAYDKQGNLIRAKRQQQRVEEPEADEEHVTPIEDEAAIQKQEIEDGLDETERKQLFQGREAARSRKAATDARGGVPPARQTDLRPYPLNHNFRSERVLSEPLREVIYQQVAGKGVDVSTVSAAFGVDIRRVAAVVRLKTTEKQWVTDGKQLAKPYNDAVMAMLPQTQYKPNHQGGVIRAHESINDLPVHPRTRQQLFWPVSESRQFTRQDAAKAFDARLLPADERIAHPELITIEKEVLADIPREERWERLLQRDAQAMKKREEAEEKKRHWEKTTQRVVHGRRWDFKFQNFSAEKTGKDGRARNAVGVRYGMPHEDRKRGMVKIPTRVE